MTGWNLPPGVTNAMIEAACGGDEVQHDPRDTACWCPNCLKQTVHYDSDKPASFMCTDCEWSVDVNDDGFDAYEESQYLRLNDEIVAQGDTP